MQISVERSRSSDERFLSEGSAILCEALGLGTFTAQNLRAICDDPHHACIAAWVDDQLAGVGIACVLEASSASRYAEFGPAATALFARGRVGLVDSLAVAPQARGLGLGKALTLACNAWLRAEGCTTSISTSWLSGQEQGSWYVFERLGFEHVGTVADFYVEVSRRDRWKCWRCGTPCRCPAALYKLAL